jgi:uncharacterized protein Veg
LLDSELRSRLERQIGAVVHVKPETGRRREAFQVARLQH